MAEFSENRAVNNSEGFLIAAAIREGRRRRFKHANGVKPPSCSSEESIECLFCNETSLLCLAPVVG